MARTVPVSSQQSPGNFLTSALWNSQVKGLIDFITAVPRFKGYCTNSTLSVTGTATTIPLDSEYYDSEGGHSNTVNNSRYTCQVAGLYLVTAHIALLAGAGNTPGQRLLDINVNGTLPADGRKSWGMQGSTNTAQADSHSIQVQLNVGDYVEMQFSQQTGSSQTIAVSAAYGPSLSVVWLSSL